MSEGNLAVERKSASIPASRKIRQLRLPLFRFRSTDIQKHLRLPAPSTPTGVFTPCPVPAEILGWLQGFSLFLCVTNRTQGMNIWTLSCCLAKACESKQSSLKNTLGSTLVPWFPNHEGGKLGCSAHPVQSRQAFGATYTNFLFPVQAASDSSIPVALSKPWTSKSTLGLAQCHLRLRDA